MRRAVPVPCDRVLFFRLGQVMPVSPAGNTHVRWRLCEQPQDVDVTLWGGECCSLGFSLSRHRPGKGGTPIEPATLASVVATLFSRKRLKKREKADKSASDFTANLAHVDRKRKQMSSRLWAYLIPVFRMVVLSPWHPEPTDTESTIGMSLDCRVDVTVLP